MNSYRWEKEPQEGPVVIRVSDSRQLAEACSQAVPGTTIIMADGEYGGSEPFTIRSEATIDAPITVRAASRGKAVISGGARIELQQSAYIVIQGLRFANTGHSAVHLNDCHHIRLTRNTFALREDGTELKWLLISGADSHHHWIDRNEFGPRRDKGMYVSSNGGNGRMSQYDVYEYNYFHGSGPSFPRSEGEIKAMRIGLSGVSMSDGYNVIQYNLFEHCDANPEIISVKSGRNEVRYNTLLNCEGHLTSRHGHHNSFYGNLFIGDGKRKGMGGFRIYGNDHRIYENVLENLTDWAVNVDSGGYDGGPEGDVYTKEVLTAHWRNYRSEVSRNVISGGPGIVIGGVKTYEPVDSKVTDNVYVGGNESFITEKAGTNTVIDGNRSIGSDEPLPPSILERRKLLTRAETGPDAP